MCKKPGDTGVTAAGVGPDGATGTVMADIDMVVAVAIAHVTFALIDGAGAAPDSAAACGAAGAERECLLHCWFQRAPPGRFIFPAIFMTIAFGDFCCNR